MEAIQYQVVEMKKIECVKANMQLKRLCNEFDFAARMLKGALVEGGNIT